MHIGIVGSRSWPKPAVVADFVEFFFGESDILVSGGCRDSPDAYAEEAYRQLESSLEPVIYPADWNAHGKRAGFLRNTDIANTSDFLVCFYDPDSKTSGCLDTVKKMKNKPWIVLTPQGDYAVNQEAKTTKDFVESREFKVIKFIEETLLSSL